MIGIVAHTKRAEKAHKLMETVGAAYMSMDSGQYGCEGNHRRTWEWLNAHNTDGWCVVLEDDACPVEGFTLDALEAAPSGIVSLYLGKKRPPHWQTKIGYAVEQAEQQDACFITAPTLLHAVAVAIRTDLIPDMLHHTHNTMRPWDYAIGAYAQSISEPVSYTWPSLVDHADGETVTQHPDRQTRTPGRTAWKTGTRTTWTPRAVTL